MCEQKKYFKTVKRTETVLTRIALVNTRTHKHLPKVEILEVIKESNKRIELLLQVRITENILKITQLYLSCFNPN
jgi:hypothetical protein